MHTTACCSSHRLLGAHCRICDAIVYGEDAHSAVDDQDLRLSVCSGYRRMVFVCCSGGGFVLLG
jgi:hypothetical protein